MVKNDVATSGNYSAVKLSLSYRANNGGAVGELSPQALSHAMLISCLRCGRQQKGEPKSRRLPRIFKFEQPNRKSSARTNLSSIAQTGISSPNFSHIAKRKSGNAGCGRDGVVRMGRD